MHPVHLADMSKAVMSKLRNGHSVRAALAAKGSGVPAFLSEDNIKKLMKAGKKGGKAVIKLGAEELHRNRSEGSGIMAGGKMKMGGFKDFKKGFSQGFNAMGGVDGIVDAGLAMAGAGISAGPSARGGATWIGQDGKTHSSGSFSMGMPKKLPKGLRGGKLSMKSITKPIGKIASNKQVQKLALDTAKDLMSGEGISAGPSARGGKMKMGTLKDFGHGFNKGFNMIPKAMGYDGAGDFFLDAGLAAAGAGISAGPSARGGAVRASQVQSIAKKIASEAVKKVKGGKIKMKSITGAISSIAKNPVVQDMALDMAKSAMGAGLIAGGKLSMKSITKPIGKIASNKQVQKLAIDTLKDAMSGEGIWAGGAHGGSVKRKVVDLIEDIGENRPRKRGESRVRQAIDLVETMRKPRGRGLYAGTRGGKIKASKNFPMTMGPHLSLPSGMRDQHIIAAAGPSGRGMFAGARGGAIGPHGELSGITNVGAGGNLMCMSNPALMPQPASENFFFHTQFPPALAASQYGN